MSDYIDRQAAIDAVGDVHPLDYNSQAIANRLKSLLSADVAPVVRCKDCAYRNGGDYCHLYGGIAYEQFVRMTDFCSRGVRMDGDDNAE